MGITSLEWFLLQQMQTQQRLPPSAVARKPCLLHIVYIENFLLIFMCNFAQH